jgi:hypothetical protein
MKLLIMSQSLDAYRCAQSLRHASCRSQPPHHCCRHHGRGPLRALLAPLFAALDTLLSTMDGDVGRCLLAIAWGHLPVELGWTKHSCLVAGAMLGEDATRLLECVHEKVAMLALERVPRMTFGQWTDVPLASLAAVLGLGVLARPPQWGPGCEINMG